jgi:hypothetical protein
MGFNARGMAQALGIDPTTPSTLYAATIDGTNNGSYLYKSVNGGSTWSNLSGFGDSHPLAIAVSPSSSSTIYVACAYDVDKSTDGGATWSLLQSGLPPGNAGISGMAIDATGKIYVAAIDGVYRSTDGTNFTKQTSGPTDAVRTVAVDPSSPNTVYAGDNDIWRSIDGGVTFTEVAGTTFGITGFAVDGTGEVYVATYTGVKKSDDGTTYGDISNGLLDNSVYVVRVAKTDPQVVFAGTYQGGVYVSYTSGE